MRHSELSAILAAEQPGAGLLAPEGEEWGGPLDVLCVERGRISAHVMVMDDLELQLVSRFARLTSRAVTELWVFTTPALMQRVKAAFPIEVGVRVKFPDGRLGIARPATVRLVEVLAWIHRLTDDEKETLAAELGCSRHAEDLAAEGLRVLGDDGLRQRVTRFFGERCPSPPLTSEELDPLQILAAVRRRIHREVVLL